VFDFHVHAGTGGAGGGTLPAEVAAKAREAGYRGVALLARCDMASLRRALPPLVRACREAGLFSECEMLAGVELVHIAPPLLGEAVEQARKLGALVVGVHCEYPEGGVPVGTTLSAIHAGTDLLLHPGSISLEEAALAADMGVALELSLASRYGFFNGHIAGMARQTGASLVTGGDVGGECRFAPLRVRQGFLRGAGLSVGEIERIEACCLRFMTQRVAGPLSQGAG